ncbi:MAG: S41 family peptidase [Clostridia bacterium]|nr:S41 family peptidase [Clostridia bacterium]MBR6647526.1 S41 family peptidase [Clostridia bacterium]
MFSKKHLVITAISTAAIVLFLYSMLIVGYMAEGIKGNPVTRARNIIHNYYVNHLTDEDIERLDDAAIDAMVQELADPYSRYLDMEELTAYEESKEEDYVGAGMQVLFDPEKETMTVVIPYDNSPAQRAGILTGDEIIEVNDIKVSLDTYEDILNQVGGKDAKAGDVVKIKLLRKGIKEPVEIELKKEHVDIQTVTFKKIDDIGYVRVTEFINRTEEEFRAAIETLKDMEVKSVIIDLRNNPGGYAHTVISMCDMLLPEGVIAYLEDSSGKREYFHSDEEELGLPMAILTNGHTASASELLAGSVQAYGLGTIVGEKSYGKAVGQTLYSLSADTALYMTNARYFTPKGECIDGQGIIPDIEVKLSDEKLSRLSFLDTEEDDQLIAAIEFLTE